MHRAFDDELEGVSRRYGAATVVDSLSFRVETGELLVLLGESGSGKTTTLKMINRLVEPSAGSIRIDGIDVRSTPGPLLRRRIGYVFQRIGLFPHLTVGENIAVTPELLGWERDRVRRRVDELLAMVELDVPMRDRFPAELSGGEQQRVGVARALAAGPTLMPSTALRRPGSGDARPPQQSFQCIWPPSRGDGVFVTHDMLEALLLGDRIAVMKDGRLVQLGTPRELLQEPASDYVRQLLGTPRRQAEQVEALIGGRPT